MPDFVLIALTNHFLLMFRKRLSSILQLFFIAATPVAAQHTLEGKIIDYQKNPVPFANVILFDAQDSTSVYQGTVSTASGIFLMEDIATDEYLIKVSFVGYEDYLQHIKISGDEELPSIRLGEATENLDEVSLNYKNPTVRREVDRLVFEVQNTSLSSGSSWDILKKTPGVIVANESLMVRNQPVVVYINDRKVQLSSSELQTLLQNYAAENIKSIEVITTPPARYDAEGGAILNIITSKIITPGYKGSISGTYTQAIFPKYSFGTSHYYKTEKLNLFANYSISDRKEFKEDESYINFIRNEDVVSRWETDFGRITRSGAHNMNLMLDYDLDENNKLSFSSNLLASPDKTSRNQVQTEIEDDLPATPNYFTTNSRLEEDLVNVALDLEYRHQFEKEGAQITARTHFTNFSQNRVQDISTREYQSSNMLLDSNDFTTDAEQQINIFMGQVDYTTPWDKAILETGLKTSVVASESGIDYLNSESAQSSNSLGVSDNFLYDENIYAGYFSFVRDWDKWSVKAGLRGEYTSREEISEAMQQIDARNYFELFPTFYVQRTFSQAHSLTFDYSRRIQRPKYESLNPFKYFLNEYTYNTGNPDLRAAISNNFNLNYTFRNQYFFDLYYRDNGGYPETLSFQDNMNFSLRRVSVNLLESSSYGLDISHGRSLTDFWYAYAYTSLFHEEQTFLAVESDYQAVTNEIDAFYGTMYNSFTLSEDGTFSGDLTFTYVSDWITGSYFFEPMTTLSIGLRKTFWQERAELTLRLEDILDKTNTRLTSRYLNQDNSFLAKPESRYIMIGLKYNFGNYRLRDNQREIEAAERERL